MRNKTLLERPTPLLRVGRGLAKLESLRPSGGVEDRIVAAWEPKDAVVVGSAGLALAAAGWARSRGVSLKACVRSGLTHEVKRVLEIWGVQLLDEAQPTHLETAEAYAATLGAELRAQIGEVAALVGPAGLALRGTLLAFPGVRCIEVPVDTVGPARAWLARTAGLLASHASAAAVQIASGIEGAVALVTATGEREFSLGDAP